MLRLAVLMALVGLLGLMALPAMAAGIPVKDGGIVRVSPLGNDSNGERADAFYSTTLTADFALCQPPAAVNDPLDALQLVAANIRLEMLGYPGQNDGDNPMNLTGGASLLLEAQGAIPAKLGVTWAPYSEWDVGIYGGLNVVNLATPEEPLALHVGGTRVDVTRLTLGPQYTDRGVGLGFELAGTF